MIWMVISLVFLKSFAVLAFSSLPTTNGNIKDPKGNCGLAPLSYKEYEFISEDFFALDKSDSPQDDLFIGNNILNNETYLIPTATRISDNVSSGSTPLFSMHDNPFWSRDFFVSFVTAILTIILLSPEVHILLEHIKTSVLYLISSPQELVCSAIKTCDKTFVLNEVERFSLNFMIYLTPEVFILRLAAFIGWSLDVYSDFRPGHIVTADEAIYQIIMMGITTPLFFKSAIPALSASLKSTSRIDEITYIFLFRPVGVTWLQYKVLSNGVIDWIDVEPDSVISSDKNGTQYIHHEEGDKQEYLYWLYSGEASIFINESMVYHIDRKRGKSIDCADEFGLLASEDFFRQIEKLSKKRSGKKEKRKNRKSKEEASQVDIPRMTVSSGPKGAKVMRLNTKMILKLMENDENLNASIRQLLLIGAQRKVGTFLSNTSK
mmetsp:Transcript_23690/g.27269  ORF Transcript_23690/g.27269 Transcript_23690/m.27269 type:complete len:434 (-) Transcript_23690:79-1380(-)